MNATPFPASDPNIIYFHNIISFIDSLILGICMRGWNLTTHKDIMALHSSQITAAINHPVELHCITSNQLCYTLGCSVGV